MRFAINATSNLAYSIKSSILVFWRMLSQRLRIVETVLLTVDVADFCKFSSFISRLRSYLAVLCRLSRSIISSTRLWTSKFAVLVNCRTLLRRASNSTRSPCTAKYLSQMVFDSFTTAFCAFAMAESTCCLTVFLYRLSSWLMIKRYSMTSQRLMI